MVKMKNENADWKSELPDGWNFYPLKYFFSFGKGLSIGKKDLIETGAPVISYGQVHSKTNSGVHSSEDLIRYVDESYYECGMNSFATSGDFIFADTSEDLEGCGNEAYVDYDKGLFAGYHTILLKAKNNEDNRYFGYLFQTDDFRYQIRSYVTRVKVYSISQVLLKRAAVIVPPYAKRIEIADYLDIKCAKIDSAISLAQSQIDTLNRYKASIITQAVTKGLDPNVEMKDSGVEWIGRIPKHWNKARLKHIIFGYKAGPFGSSLITSKLNTEGNILVYTPEHIAKQSVNLDKNLYLPDERKDEMKQFIVQKGNIIFPIVGSFGRAMIITEDMPIGIINQRLAKFMLKTNMISQDYFMWLFAKSSFYDPYYLLEGHGIAVQNITKQMIYSMPIMLPPIEEQNKISAYLENKCSKITSAIDKQNQIIEKLNEYKRALIYSAVTGKIDVTQERDTDGNIA